MNHVNPTKDKTEITEVVGGIKVITSEFKVKVPIYEEEVVKRPVFIDTPVQVPTELKEALQEMAQALSIGIMEQVTKIVKEELAKAIDERISTIKAPRIVEELQVVYKEVPVERAVITDVEIERPIFVNKPIINPIMKDVEVVNAVIVDQAVTNAVISDIRVTNAIIKDVEVERAVIREKVIEVIHKQCMDEKGNPL